MSYTNLYLMYPLINITLFIDKSVNNTYNVWKVDLVFEFIEQINYRF